MNELKKRTKVPNNRKKYWFPNMLLFYLLRLNVCRDKNLWIFGSWEGNRYDDNSRHLFEYIREMHPDIRAVWLANCENIVSEIRKKGYEAYISGSREGRRIQLRAGAVFYTNGIDDFGNIGYFYGAKIISLWHGFGIKNIYFAGMKKDIRYWKNRLQNRIFSWVGRDITISSSKACSDYFRRAFCLRKEQIQITGFPRNDIFRKQLKPSDVFGDKKADEYRFMLYMPTYRSYKDFSIQETVEQIAGDRVLSAAFRKQKTVLLVKKHYLTELEWKHLPSEIKVLEDSQVSSVQELLAISDLIITDYSSCILDYVLSGKPAVLYAPDRKTYCMNVGMAKKWHKVYDRYSLDSYQELKQVLLECLSGEKGIADETTEYLRGICEDESIKGTNYCENVYRLVYQSVFGR